MIKNAKKIILYGGPYNDRVVSYEGYNTMKMSISKPGYVGYSIYEIQPSKCRGFFLENQWVIKLTDKS